uniref:Putative secreted protein n=1 Tax=Anopheles darlingi TaxID=43151 RepID=A0A2M4DAX6_ANODA
MFHLSAHGRHRRRCRRLMLMMLLMFLFLLQYASINIHTHTGTRAGARARAQTVQKVRADDDDDDDAAVEISLFTLASASLLLHSLSHLATDGRFIGPARSLSPAVVVVVTFNYDFTRLTPSVVSGSINHFHHDHDDHCHQLGGGGKRVHYCWRVFILLLFLAQQSINRGQLLKNTLQKGLSKTINEIC